MDTHFAPVGRATDKEIARQITFVSSHSVVTTLLHAVSGMVAVLNEQRQIVALNDGFLHTIGINDPQTVLGLRPGEALRCIHAHDMPDGCGTGRFCGSCGAAVATVAAFASDEPVERLCVATVERAGRHSEVCLSVRACAWIFEGRKLILLFVQDVTDAQRWAAIERVFFHDLGNVVMSLQGAALALGTATADQLPTLAPYLQGIVARFSQEVSLQRALLDGAFTGRALDRQPLVLASLFAEVRATFAQHPAARNKTFDVQTPVAAQVLRSDPVAVQRVLTNMLANAFEATCPGGEVKLWVEEAPGSLSFCVWNRQAIPDTVAPRIFQRYFSTKTEAGHGLGTYSMKLLGESYLGGIVDFVTGPDIGTTFRLQLPT